MINMTTMEERTMNPKHEGFAAHFSGVFLAMFLDSNYVESYRPSESRPIPGNDNADDPRITQPLRAVES